MQHNRELMFTGIPRKGKGNPETTRFKREDKINYSAQTMERFMYRGLFCWQPPGNGVNEKFLSMGRPDEYLNRCHQFFGLHYSRLFADTYTTCLHNAVLQWLYKGKDPIERESVVLLMIKDTSKLNPFR